MSVESTVLPVQLPRNPGPEAIKNQHVTYMTRFSKVKGVSSGANLAIIVK
jgi:hypothetical protein